MEDVLRIDGFISVYIVHSLLRLFGTARGKTMPILMYHSVSENNYSAAHPYYETNTTPAQFCEQIRWLRKAGFRSVPLSEVATGEARDRGVAITFDDGYRDILTSAWPVLREHGFSATVFLATDFVGSSFKGRSCLSWDEIREARREGIVFGSHTASHAELISMSDAAVEYEWSTSKERIEQELGEKVDLFSYPYAFPEANPAFVHRLRHILDKMGYVSGVTTSVGSRRRHADSFFLPRLPINTFDEERLFLAKLEGAYDWLHIPQVLCKQVKRCCRLS